MNAGHRTQHREMGNLHQSLKLWRSSHLQAQAGICRIRSALSLIDARLNLDGSVPSEFKLLDNLAQLKLAKFTDSSLNIGMAGPNLGVIFNFLNSIARKYLFDTFEAPKLSLTIEIHHSQLSEARAELWRTHGYQRIKQDAYYNSESEKFEEEVLVTVKNLFDENMQNLSCTIQSLMNSNNILQFDANSDEEMILKVYCPLETGEGIVFVIFDFEQNPHPFMAHYLQRNSISGIIMAYSNPCYSRAETSFEEEMAQILTIQPCPPPIFHLCAHMNSNDINCDLTTAEEAGAYHNFIHTSILRNPSDISRIPSRDPSWAFCRFLDVKSAGHQVPSYGTLHRDSNWENTLAKISSWIYQCARVRRSDITRIASEARSRYHLMRDFVLRPNNTAWKATYNNSIIWLDKLERDLNTFVENLSLKVGVEARKITTNSAFNPTLKKEVDKIEIPSSASPSERTRLFDQELSRILNDIMWNQPLLAWKQLVQDFITKSLFMAQMTADPLLGAVLAKLSFSAPENIASIPSIGVWESIGLAISSFNDPLQGSPSKFRDWKQSRAEYLTSPENTERILQSAILTIKASVHSFLDAARKQLYDCYESGNLLRRSSQLRDMKSFDVDFDFLDIQIWRTKGFELSLQRENSIKIMPPPDPDRPRLIHSGSDEHHMKHIFSYSNDKTFAIPASLQRVLSMHSILDQQYPGVIVPLLGLVSHPLSTVPSSISDYEFLSLRKRLLKLPKTDPYLVYTSGQTLLEFRDSHPKRLLSVDCARSGLQKMAFLMHDMVRRGFGPPDFRAYNLVVVEQDSQPISFSWLPSGRSLEKSSYCSTSDDISFALECFSSLTKFLISITEPAFKHDLAAWKSGFTSLNDIVALWTKLDQLIPAHTKKE